MPDIDIDFSTPFNLLDYFPEAVRASMVVDGELKKHNCGAYLQNIPKDKITGFAAIPYKEAEKLGYMKIDFLHLSVLDVFQSKDEIRSLLKKEPDWNLLQVPSVVTKLFQLSNHHEMLTQLKPRSVVELADSIALIRPGKKMLVSGYLKDKEGVRKALYQKSERYSFKKSHAIAYALTIVLQLHLIKGGIL